VKPQFRIWLVAGLLLAVVNVSGPTARAASLRAASCITWADHSGCDQSEVSEPNQPAPFLRWQSSLRLSLDNPFTINSALDRALFQRPPPSLVRS
jgi:hypothetical protein